MVRLSFVLLALLLLDGCSMSSQDQPNVTEFPEIPLEVPSVAIVTEVRYEPFPSSSTEFQLPFLFHDGVFDGAAPCGKLYGYSMVAKLSHAPKHPFIFERRQERVKSTSKSESSAGAGWIVLDLVPPTLDDLEADFLSAALPRLANPYDEVFVPSPICWLY